MAPRRKRRRQPAARAPVGDPEAFTAAYFLLPLEVPLSIPDKSIVRGQEKPPPKRGFEDDYISVEWDDQEGLVGCRLSCCFHQITSPKVDAAQVAVLEAARTAFPFLQLDAAPDELGTKLAAVTVAEVAVHLAEHGDEAIDAALDEAIEFIADVQRAYCTLAQEPAPIMTHARLPLLVPYMVREGVPGVHPSDWPDEAELEFVMPRAPRRREFVLAPSEDNPAQWTLEQLGDVMGPVLDGPFRHVHESWRSASVALEQGDYAVAAILTGVTCEQIIRALLLCLLWEDELDPAEAFRVLYERNGNTRNANALLTEITARLFDARETGLAAQDMTSGVLGLRNKVLHRAHQPTHDEAREASELCTRFAEWARFAVLTRLDRYAVTAAMTVSKPDVDDKTAIRLDEALTSNLWPTRPNENVRHYQIEIDRHLPGNEAKRLGTVDRLPSEDWAMVSLAYPNGEVRWVGVEEQNWLAFLARPPRYLPARAQQHLREGIKQTQVENAEPGVMPVVAYRWNDLQPVPQSATPLLHSWFDLGPLLRAERYARCPTPFIPAD